MASLSSILCSSCTNRFKPNEEIVNASGETYHTYCFVCAQCFQPFDNGIYYEFEGRKYCEYDFQLLFAPACRACKEFINGRVIKAMNSNWHPECFCCELCEIQLADLGFIKNSNRALCRDCNTKEKLKSSGKIICNKCKLIIEDDILRYKNEAYHPYHFNCKTCNVELTGTAREIRADLYCLNCHDKMNIPICAACRRPIDGEIVINALGKQWHMEHFVCTKCEKPFHGSKYFEKRGLAFCEFDYKMLFGERCYTCNEVSVKDVFSAWNKIWCSEHFACYLCDEKMNQKTKFYALDLKPICKHCFERLPSKVRSAILKASDKDAKLNLK